MSASSVDIPSISSEIQKINEDTIPVLLNYFSKYQHPAPQSAPDITTTTTTNSSIPPPAPDTAAAATPTPTINNENNHPTTTKEIPQAAPDTTTNTNTTISSNDNNSNGGSSSSTSLHHQRLRLHSQVEKLQRDLNYVKEFFDNLKKFEDDVGNPIKSVQRRLGDIVKHVTEPLDGSFQPDLVETKLRGLNDIVTKLKLQVPSPHKISSANSDAHRYMRSNPLIATNGSDARNLFDGLPNLHNNEHFRLSSAFKDIQEIYKGLNIKSKLCLLCFAAFPEDEVVKKRLLINWWIGEGFVVQQTAGDVFKELTVKDFIKPVYKKRRLVADSFKMSPFIRSAVIMLAQEAGFFDFDYEGTPTSNFSSCQRACLVKSSGGSAQQVSITSRNLDQGNLQTLFNVSEPYLGFNLEWFSKMKNVNVLCLGRWQSSSEHHIEVDDTEFLKGLRNMKYLRFFSLQGISRITELPDSVSKLINLRILDLRACHNLEVLPDGISSLKNLTHLDMSECYLLEHMPKGLASLLQLQVLKGFVVGDLKSRSPCTLGDLINLKQLRKLSISTGWEAFPTEKELTTFQQFTALRKLTIAWGGGSLQVKSDNSGKQESGAVNVTNAAATTIPDNKGVKAKQENIAAVPTKLPKRTLSKLTTFKRDKVAPPVNQALPLELEKLDLQCFPLLWTPSWLMPGNLTKLKKLYIRGGKLHCLGQVQKVDAKWRVEILRLKFMCQLKMDWSELQALFPELIYLEKVKCPKLTFFPCDESGVWVDEDKVTNAVARN